MREESEKNMSNFLSYAAPITPSEESEQMTNLSRTIPEKPCAGLTKTTKCINSGNVMFKRNRIQKTHLHNITYNIA
jgi:hypothetical protein